jgi:hypothetical protein
MATDVIAQLGKQKTKYAGIRAAQLAVLSATKPTKTVGVIAELSKQRAKYADLDLGFKLTKSTKAMDIVTQLSKQQAKYADLDLGFKLTKSTKAMDIVTQLSKQQTAFAGIKLNLGKYAGLDLGRFSGLDAALEEGLIGSSFADFAREQAVAATAAEELADLEQGGRPWSARERMAVQVYFLLMYAMSMLLLTRSGAPVGKLVGDSITTVGFDALVWEGSGRWYDWCTYR